MIDGRVVDDDAGRRNCPSRAELDETCTGVAVSNVVGDRSQHIVCIVDVAERMLPLPLPELSA